MVWPPAPAVPAVQLTNVAPLELHIESPLRRLGPGMARERPHPGYSLDLIDDTHH